jgi:hypothetical protein
VAAQPLRRPARAGRDRGRLGSGSWCWSPRAPARPPARWTLGPARPAGAAVRWLGGLGPASAPSAAPS